MATPTSPFQVCERKFPAYPCSEEEIIELERYDVLVKSNPDDETDFVTQEKVRVKSSVNRTDYINSFRDDVGIENILKKVALSGDVSLLNQIKRTELPKDLNDPEGREIVQDLTPLFNGEKGAAKLGDLAQQIYASLPADLVGGRSFAEFCENVTDADIAAYIASKNKVEKKEGGENE